jgi:hypothetical protein
MSDWSSILDQSLLVLLGATPKVSLCSTVLIQKSKFQRKSTELRFLVFFLPDHPSGVGKIAVKLADNLYWAILRLTSLLERLKLLWRCGGWGPTLFTPPNTRARVNGLAYFGRFTSFVALKPKGLKLATDICNRFPRKNTKARDHDLKWTLEPQSGSKWRREEQWLLRVTQERT